MGLTTTRKYEVTLFMFVITEITEAAFEGAPHVLFGEGMSTE